MTKRSKTVSMDLVTKLSHSLQLSVRSALSLVAKELRHFAQSNRGKKFQNRAKLNNKAQQKFRESCRSSAASKKMASCLLSSKNKCVKNGLSPVQQKSKIPVRRVPRLENNSGKRSSSEDEVNMKRRILRNRLEKSQNKPPSRIPIAIGRASSKDVGRDKISKNVIAATGKKPLGRDSGIVNI